MRPRSERESSGIAGHQHRGAEARASGMSRKLRKTPGTEPGPGAGVLTPAPRQQGAGGGGRAHTGG